MVHQGTILRLLHRPSVRLRYSVSSMTSPEDIRPRYFQESKQISAWIIKPETGAFGNFEPFSLRFPAPLMKRLRRCLQVVYLED